MEDNIQFALGIFSTYDEIETKMASTSDLSHFGSQRKVSLKFMSKILKRKKKSKHVAIEKIEAMALCGEDTNQYFGTPKRMPSREVRKMQNLEHIIKVNVDLTESFLE